MNDKELLADVVSSFRTVADIKVVKNAIDTLLKIHKNILNNKENMQYRKIKIENPTFQQKIWNFYPARQFMLLCGWIEVQDVLVFNYDEGLEDIINVLLANRPYESVWTENATSEDEKKAQLREEELKKKAAEKRQDELKQFMKEKKYREELAKTVKAEIQADQKEKQSIQHERQNIDTRSEDTNSSDDKSDSFNESR